MRGTPLSPNLQRLLTETIDETWISLQPERHNTYRAAELAAFECAGHPDGEVLCITLAHANVGRFLGRIWMAWELVKVFFQVVRD